MKTENASLQAQQALLLNHRSDFFTREAAKTLRTNVSFALEQVKGGRVVQVTSSLAGEGASLTAANLALAFAQAEKRVLLVDCDLRRPRLGQLLELEAPLGLSSVLTDPDTCTAAILSTEEPHLSVLLAGAVPQNPSELLGSARMHQLLEALRQSFDYVILDSAPVNAVTDSVVLASACDGVLLTVRAGKTRQTAVKQAVQRLESAHVKPLGFVLQDAPRKNGWLNRRKNGSYAGKFDYELL